MPLGGDGGEIDTNRGRATDSKRHLVTGPPPQPRRCVVRWKPTNHQTQSEAGLEARRRDEGRCG